MRFFAATSEPFVATGGSTAKVEEVETKVLKNQQSGAGASSTVSQ